MDFLPEIKSTFWSIGRAKTYEYWPFQSSDNACNPQRMASAGFFTVGGKREPDLVECFICGKQLDGWDPNDDPWKEHMKHQPECPFVKLNKQNEASWTVIDLFDLFKKYSVKECTDELNKAKNKVKEESSRLSRKIPYVSKGLQINRKDAN